MRWTKRVALASAAAFIVATVTPTLAPASADPPGATPMGMAMPMPPMSVTDESKVPHYFGPYSNWANSPQVLADAIVTIDAPTSSGGTTAAATATVNPKTGGIDSIAVTDPGSGYATSAASAPAVTITSPGATPSPVAAAHAVVSSGVVTSIDVAEAGFGFTAPKVTITGGGAPTTPAVAQASGAVDDLTFTVGSLFSANTVVTIDPPDADYCTPPATTPVTPSPCATATAKVVMNSDSTNVVGVTLIDGGSGYTHAPGVTFTDPQTPAPGTLPVAPTATSTINIGRIDVVADTGAPPVTGGIGYSVAPTVTIADTVGTPDKGASATATIAAMGAVTNVVVDTHGAGYVTPGIKKFVDTLAGLGPSAANDLGNYIPVAQPDTTTYPGTDYYEIAVVQYYHRYSSDLPPTLERGYVQLSTSVIPGGKVPLYNALLNDPGLLSTGTPGNGTPIMGAGGDATVQYTGVDKPRYLGPTIVASKDRPVRILFRNLLPTGVDGNLFLPVDTSIMGAGPGAKAMTLDANNVPMDMATDEGSVLDGVRNPMCAMADPVTMAKPTTCYTENRATLHLHGGITPWISDGTPHQWTTPAGESTDYPKGVSVSNVPDMPDPGPGAETFFYTNQQSARLMFYHDHAWGITRLNVYAGEAAGYLLTDKMEQDLIKPGGALAGLGTGTPLVIQDKTFVPQNIHSTDPTWDTSLWGGAGSLWTPHVYMPAQNPGSPTGQSSYGRWMYGPWFWPPAKDAKYPPIPNPYYKSCNLGDAGCTVPESTTCDPATADNGFCEPAQIPSTPNVSVGMEAFNDTPVVNGTAYPTTTVDPKAYRYRILNAANDRFWNLQWYVADPTTGTLSEVALKPAEVAAAQTDPNVFPTPDLTKSPAGPDWVQIGTEGGFLPTPTVVSGHQPTTWITDPTRFDVGNVDKHSLLVAPAERADVIVDFSAYRGKTLILYNDAPAAFPARQANQDYYTGGPDLTGNGGAPTTLAGYGPNTRTIMQVKVSSAAPAVAWDRPNTTVDRMGDLMAAFAHHTTSTTDTTTGITTPAQGVFESGSDPIVVGQNAYNAAYGTKFSATGNCTLAAAGPATCDGFARIQQQGNTDPTKADKFTFNTLAGALPDPVTGIAPTPTAALQIPLQPKALHDEMNSANFDEWGRMTANLGLEAPGATPLLQNIILYPYVNPPTESLDATDLPSSLDVTPISSAADGTQIWKITHNGVDTHPIHFHLYDVQVLNRVTWDNIIMPPDPNELGWKDTVRVSPLEDTYVVVRPIVPTIPFGIPNSKRLLNPMMPEHAKGNVNGPNGTEAGFNNTDVNGNPVDAISNEMTDFGWEYVYHCHILSHEEMDMMRPVTVTVPSTAPDSPGPLTVTRPGVILHWTDGTPVDYTNPATWHNVKAEIGYRIERAPETSANVQPADDQFAPIANGLANSTSYADTPPDPSATYWYKVTAYNQGGDSPSAYLRVMGAPKAPTALTATVQLDATAPVGATVALAWVNNAVNADSVIVERSVNGGAFSLLTTLPASSTSYTDTPALPGAYSYRVAAVNTVGTSAYAGPASVTVAKPASSTVLSSSANPSTGHTSVTFTATVTPVLATAKPTGSVSFTIDAGAPTVVPLNAATGTATLVAPSLVTGTHTITASYSGDVIFLGSTAAPLIQQVTGTDTTTVVTSSLNPSRYGQSVTFTATVSPASGTTVPTGLVRFSIDGTPVGGTVALDGSGRATYTTNALTVPSHQISATYNGSAGFFASTSASITQNVTKAPSAITVTTSGSPSSYGQSVTFTARVTPAGTNPQGVTGFVQFTIDGVGGAANLKAVNAVTGVATLVTTTLAVGNHTVTAQYTGDGNFTSSAVASVGHRVQQAATRVTLVSSANPANRRQSVTFTATVSAVAPGGGTPTGTVRFRIDGRNVGAQVTLVGGVARYTTSTLGRGRHSIQVVYNGSASYLTSTSATLRQRIL